ncbi:MAG: DUF4956 domain-containing protein [Caldilinea sp.]|nr:DUF4956 domain-containing protein [Caldilinea sp.]MDW8438872.1 DUF4956 domain-containing protein [Caldilineaceae bacterium]
MNILTEVMPGFALTLATGLIIFGLGYTASRRSRPEYFFTYLSFSLMAYLVTSLLRDVQLTLGFSFGLLAVFTILRFRSINIAVREMTYLYLAIMLPFANALFVATRVSFSDVLIINAGLALFVVGIDRIQLAYFGSSQLVHYEKIDLIQANNERALLDDLSRRTGRCVKRYIVEEIDFLRDTALLTVYFEEKPKIHDSRTQ